jgi:hypothetical protein
MCRTSFSRDVSKSNLFCIAKIDLTARLVLKSISSTVLMLLSKSLLAKGFSMKSSAVALHRFSYYILLQAKNFAQSEDLSKESEIVDLAMPE